MSIKKYILIAAAVFTVVLGPCFLLSNWGLDFVQGILDKRADAGASKWTQYAIGKIYYLSMRPERAAVSLKTYIDRYEEPKDERYWNAWYFRALALAEAKQTRPAAETFYKFLDEAPRAHPSWNEAAKEFMNLRSVAPDLPIPEGAADR